MNTKFTLTGWMKNLQRANGYPFNRSFESRVRTAYASQKRRAGRLTRRDDFTVDDLGQMIIEQNNSCPICGFQFENTFVRNHEEGYTWEICHIRKPGDGGYLTRKNLYLAHTDCNKCVRDDEYDFMKIIRKESVQNFLDLLRYWLTREMISQNDKRYRNYFRLMARIDAGFNPNQSGRR